MIQIGTGLVILIGWTIILGFIVFALFGRMLASLQDAHNKELAVLRDDLDKEVQRKATTQRAVIKGQIAEQLYPLMPNCPYLPSDMKFFGQPFDYLIIDGLTNCKDGDGRIEEIIFADIKTGTAKLSRHQRAIREAVEQGRVSWRTIQL